MSFADRLMRLQAKEEPKLFIDEVQKESSILEDIKAKVDATEERTSLAIEYKVRRIIAYIENTKK